MNLETIQTELESCNYYTQIISGTLIIGTDPQQDSDHPEIGFFKAFCSVEIDNETIVVEYGQAQISIEERFSTEAMAVSFIKTTFPLL